MTKTPDRVPSSEATAMLEVESRSFPTPGTLVGDAQEAIDWLQSGKTLAKRPISDILQKLLSLLAEREREIERLDKKLVDERTLAANIVGQYERTEEKDKAEISRLRGEVEVFSEAHRIVVMQRDNFEKDAKSLRQREAALVGALEFYADEKHYMARGEYYLSTVQLEGGKQARATLSSTKESRQTDLTSKTG